MKKLQTRLRRADLRLRRVARDLSVASVLTAILACAASAQLSATGATTIDSTNIPRLTFSNTETIGFQQRVSNAAPGGRITFSFQVLSPSGAVAFTQIGNIVPGTVGNSQSQLTGIPISSFYSTPGTYLLKCFAAGPGGTITQTVNFTVSSPNVILSYPPNGAQGLTDRPLTFQWVGSGAASYRLTVGFDPSFSTPPPRFVQTVSGGQSSLSYPTSPSDPLQLLTAGQAYYWKVEALDNNGNRLAVSQPPFSFTVASAAPLTRDLAIVSIAVAGAPDAQGNIPFAVVVRDQGATTESAVPVAFTLAGLQAAGSPATIATIGPATSLTLNFSAAIPPTQASAVAVACVNLFDDVPANNCQTLTVSAQATSQTSAAAGPGGITQSPQQIWQQIETLLQQQGVSLVGYDLVAMEGSMTADQLAALLDALRQNQAQVSVSGPPLNQPPPPPIPVATAPAPPPIETAPPPSVGPVGGAASTATASVPAPKEGAEFSGTAPAQGDQTQTLTIIDDATWRRVWPKLSNDAMPPVDFGRTSVVAVVGGSASGLTDIEILDVRKTGSGLAVKYRLIGEGKTEGRKSQIVPFLLRVTPMAGHDAVFIEAKEGPSHDEH